MFFLPSKTNLAGQAGEESNVCWFFLKYSFNIDLINITIVNVGLMGRLCG